MIFFSKVHIISVKSWGGRWFLTCHKVLWCIFLRFDIFSTCTGNYWLMWYFVNMFRTLICFLSRLVLIVPWDEHLLLAWCTLLTYQGMFSISKVKLCCNVIVEVKTTLVEQGILRTNLRIWTIICRIEFEFPFCSLSRTSIHSIHRFCFLFISFEWIFSLLYFNLVLFLS